MCGLIGFSGKKEGNLEYIKLLMLHNSMSRGVHATGFYNSTTGLIKQAVPAEEFLEANAKKLKTNKLIIAHVRHATVGDKENDALAHPFEYDKIVFQHNGTLKNHIKIAKDYSVDDKYRGVDSQILGKAVENCFKQQTPFKVLNEYEGAAATMTIDKSTNTLYVTRDEERELFFGRHPSGGLYISSIRRGLVMIGCTEISIFTPYHIYEIKDGIIVNVERKFNKILSLNPSVISDTHVREIKLLGGRSVKVPKIGQVFKGMAVATLDTSYLLGLYAECDWVGHSNPITKGNHYLIEDVVPMSNFPMSPRVARVKNDRNNYSNLALTCFHTVNIFPYESRKMKVIYPEGFESDVVLSQTVEVAYYLIGSKTIYIKTPQGIEEVDTRYVRILNENEEKGVLTGEEIDTSVKDTKLRDNLTQILLNEEGLDIDDLIDSEGVNAILWESLRKFNDFSTSRIEVLLKESNHETVKKGLENLKDFFNNFKDDKILNLT